MRLTGLIPMSIRSRVASQLVNFRAFSLKPKTNTPHALARVAIKLPLVSLTPFRIELKLGSMLQIVGFDPV